MIGRSRRMLFDIKTASYGYTVVDAAWRRSNPCSSHAMHVKMITVAYGNGSSTAGYVGCSQGKGSHISLGRAR